MSVEAKVGFFVVLGLAMLFLLTTQVSEFKNVNAEGYRVQVFVDDSTGLEINSKVKMNGISIGWVESFSMADDFIVLNLFIENGYQIPKDSEVQLVQESLLGSKIVAINRGHSPIYLGEGSFIKRYKKLASFEKTSDSFFQTSEEFRQLAQEIRSTLNQDRRDELEGAISNLATILRDLKGVIQENRDGVKNTVTNIESASSNLPAVIESLERTLDKYHSVGANLDRRLPEVLDSIQILVTELNGTVSDAKEPLINSLDSVEGFFSKGEETIKELDKIILSLTKSELQFSMRAEHNFRDETFSTYTNIAYLPNPNTYYLFSLVNAPVYDEYKSDGTIKGSQLHEDGDTLFSAQYGKRYGDWLFRAGLIESTGGLGIDFFAFADKLKFSLEAFDFNAVNDIRNDGANLKASLRYRVYDHIDLLVGGTNLINSHSALFMGVGFYFIDNDLKAFMGAAGGGL
jgi:phospholipid/cholesterol/gamma-HCH transport system substrate-binding protein